ncbi:MaoC family dehydratase [Sphingomonas crocodyli]|uniref:MaoC family dehydratase n=1 Tax=Sphingomonas crocodyli TaxID=1979270 RepID=A0A437LVN7_9SPHN|nr:MaoC family dehydratase [Sphingomonas crocodyli]RVT89442.1 MaoC family dehydratase [Sphingomonas crocodyli]
MRWFEDYEIGHVERFGAYVVSRDEVIDFAKKFDPQPFHLDDKAAAANPIFGRLAASGWHSCAMLMRMLTDHWTEDGHFSLAGTGVDELRWLKPVYPGDVLSAEAEVLAKKASGSKPIGFIDYRLAMFNQLGETVMTLKVTNIQPRRPE